MLNFSNCKINIGLDIISKRNDGYHNIETVFYPVPFYDILEILPSNEFLLINKGIEINCPLEKNLCYKAFKIIEKNFNINPIKIILYKKIPFGTGLGAGSANAAFTLKLLNKFFNLQLSFQQLENYASEIGSDCAFFIKNEATFASEKGNVFEKIKLNLNGFFLLLAFPNFTINTKEAYLNCKPSLQKNNIKDIIRLPIEKWNQYLKNDFENYAFKKIKILSKIKDEMYEKGALYAQMSGSGSCIYGIFKIGINNIKLNSCENTFACML